MLGVQYDSINCEEGVLNYRTVFTAKMSSKCGYVILVHGIINILIYTTVHQDTV